MDSAATQCFIPELKSCFFTWPAPDPAGYGDSGGWSCVKGGQLGQVVDSAATVTAVFTLTLLQPKKNLLYY